MPDLGRRAGALALALVLAALPAGGAAAQCLPERESREALSSGKVDRLAAVVARAGLSMKDVVSAELCTAGGGYVYHVKVLGPGGRLQEVRLPAK